jgi:citrate lyase subunit beta/citryl-CoA lyase
MNLRSLLFVPGDNEAKLARGRRAPSDALILDLEDSVTAERKPAARRLVTDFLRSPRDAASPSLWVRINPLTTAEAAADLGSVMAGSPDGIVLPKATRAELADLSAELDALEHRHGITQGSTGIIPIATETPASLFDMSGYAGSRLTAMTWGAEDLSVALGARQTTDANGEWLMTFQLARSLCLLAARAANVTAIDTVYTDLGNSDGLRKQAKDADRDGFTGKLAIHPAQLEVINQVFRPSADEIAHARRVVEAFETAGEEGVIALDGMMLDRPHLQRAEQTLARAAREED